MNELNLSSPPFLHQPFHFPHLSLQEAMDGVLAYNYVEAVVKYDISRVDGVKRDASFAQRLLRSMARHQGTQASMSTIHDDLAAGDDSSKTTEESPRYESADVSAFLRGM